MFEVYTIHDCIYCQNTLMTLDKYHLPYTQIQVSLEEKEHYKKLHGMEIFPHIFLITNKKKSKRKNGENIGVRKIKIGGDQDFQTFIRIAYELKNKKINISTLEYILSII
jgi:glutaredoxin